MILCEVCGIPANMMDASGKEFHYYCSYHWYHRNDEVEEIEIPSERLEILYS